jgi:hypothetical protein
MKARPLHLVALAGGLLCLNCSFQRATPEEVVSPPGSTVDASRPPDVSKRVCRNLECQLTTCTLGDCSVPACPAGARTTATGTVYDPAGRVPLFNASVFVPNDQVAPLSDGVRCDCASWLSGDPLAVATTGAQGHFTLANVPVGSNIPLVIQIGKWRREATISTVACTNNVIDAESTRLPRNHLEGHLPKIALTTGGADALECLLRKIGIDDAEFTPEGEAGRINLFAGGLHDGAPMAKGSPGTNAYRSGLNGGAMFTDAESWWENVDNLKQYDVVLHSCEGVPNSTNKSVNARQALQTFADAGGRVFASHWHNYWIENGPAPWPTTATFNHQPDPKSPFTSLIDTSSTKGMAMASWLSYVGASTTAGQLIIQGAKHTVDASNNSISQRWIYSMSPASVQYFSFETPVGAANKCGKVVFSDLHVSAGTSSATDDKSSPTLPFPTGCVNTALSPQEKALEFMLFDLSSCTFIVG